MTTIPDDTEELTLDVIKIECGYHDMPVCYVRDFNEMKTTLEFMLGESDCWGDAADDFKVTVTLVKMGENEFNALESWEDLI